MLLDENAVVDELLILLSLAKLSSDEKNKILVLFPLADSVLLFKLAKENQTIPLIWKTINDLGLNNQLTEVTQRDFAIESEMIAKNNHNRIESGKILLKDFTNSGVRVVLLKGIYFAESIYHNPLYKKMNDIDILIPKADVYKVLEILKNLITKINLKTFSSV